MRQERAVTSPTTHPAHDGELLGRLQNLEDERAVLALLHSYGHAIDYGLEERWVDCFTDDATFEVQRRTEPTTCWTGRERLRQFAARHTRAPAAYHKHIVVDAVIELDGDKASCDSYFLRVDAAEEPGRARIWAMGRYRDEIVRCADGRWRFARRLAEIEDT
jgi:hypothetical protein